MEGGKGRGRKKVHFSTVFASQAVGMRKVSEDIWVASFSELDAGLTIDLVLY
jgi:hypothetical protein